MLWACINVLKGQNNTFENFEDRVRFISAQEGQKELKFDIFGYFFDNRIWAINNVKNLSENRGLVSFEIFKYIPN